MVITSSSPSPIPVRLSPLCTTDEFLDTLFPKYIFSMQTPSLLKRSTEPSMSQRESHPKPNAIFYKMGGIKSD